MVSMYAERAANWGSPSAFDLDDGGTVMRTPGAGTHGCVHARVAAFGATAPEIEQTPPGLSDAARTFTSTPSPGLIFEGDHAVLTMRPYVWEDPSRPLTVPNRAGRRALVDVRDDVGRQPFGFKVDHGDGELTVRWPGIVCAGDDLTQHPVPPPPGPLNVKVIANE
jgi:hypothetical protein